MKPHEFVEAVRRWVMEAAVADTISVVRKPPGRAPAQALLELSTWFNDLSESDRAMTELAYVPIPELSEIASDPQFEPVEITREEFERVWRRRNVKFPKHRVDGSFTVLAHFWSADPSDVERARAYVVAWLGDHRDIDLAAEFSEAPRVVVIPGWAFSIAFEGRADCSRLWKDWMVLLTMDVSKALTGVRFERFES